MDLAESRTCGPHYKNVGGECIKKRKGLIVSIYKHEGKSYSLGGVSEFHDKALLLMDEPSAQVFEESEDIPILRVVRRRIFGKDYVHAEPVEPRGGSYAAGGTFIESSDSRFSQFVNPYPISLHDRDMEREG